MLREGILGLLNYGPMTGYELMELFKKSLNHFWVAQTSQIYRELQTIEKAGLAVSEKVPQKGKPDRVVYTITPAGRAVFAEWVNSISMEAERRKPILMKVFFLGEGSTQNARKHFEIFRDESNMYVELLTAAQESEGDPVRQKYWRMTVDYGIRLMRMNAQWAEDCLIQLEERK